MCYRSNDKHVENNSTQVNSQLFLLSLSFHYSSLALGDKENQESNYNDSICLTSVLHFLSPLMNHWKWLFWIYPWFISGIGRNILLWVSDKFNRFFTFNDVIPRLQPILHFSFYNPLASSKERRKEKVAKLWYNNSWSSFKCSNWMCLALQVKIYLTWTSFGPTTADYSFLYLHFNTIKA